MAKGLEDNYRLYVGKEAAIEFMPNKPALRIEILVGKNATVFWAYEYEANQ